MSSVGQMYAHAKSLAPEHPSKPVTKSDKAMSKRHKKHRKQVEKMAAGPKKKELHEKYNLGHGLEHAKQLSPKGRQKLIKKLEKVKVKILKK